MKGGTIQVALAADERYFPGLACAIFSVILGTDREQGIQFHVMDGGIGDGSWDFLENKIAALGGGISLKRYRIAKAGFAGFPTDYLGGVMTYARLLMESLIEEEEVIYVDSDLLCLRNMRELWEEPMGTDLIAACQDWGVNRLAEDCVFELSEEDARRGYFNAGFMKINLDLWRRESVQTRTMELLREYGARCRWHDQTALNAICKDRVRYLDGGYNRYYIHGLTLEDCTEARVNIHFATKIKPWQTHRARWISNVIWRIYFEKCMRGWRMGRDSGGRIEAACYHAGISLLNRRGAALIGIINVARRGLMVLEANEGAEAAGQWLERRKVEIQIIRWAWKKVSSLDLRQK